MATKRCIVLMEETPDPTGRVTSIWRPRLDYAANPSFRYSVLANAREFCIVDVTGDDAEIATLDSAPHTYVLLENGGLRGQHHTEVRALMNSVGLPNGLPFTGSAIANAIHNQQRVMTDTERLAAKQRARVRQASL